MKKLVAILAISLVAAACSSNDTATDTSQASTTTTEATTTTPAPAPTTTTTTEATKTTTTTTPTTTTIPVPPSVSLWCPDEVTYPFGTSVRAEYGYSFDSGSSAITNWHIDYGDGGTWDSPTAKHAEDNLFWHEYTSPGQFYPTVTLTDAAGLTASASCGFILHWDEPPPTNPQPPGSSTGGFDPASCTFDGIPLWGSVYFTETRAFADFSIDVSSSSFFSELSVYLTGTKMFAGSCGKWYPTETKQFSDFTVYVTDSSFFSDFTIFLTDTAMFAGT